MRPRTRAAALAGMVALTTAGAAACGSSNGSHPGGARATGGSAGAAHTVRAAYTATTHAKTASFRLDETIRAGGSGGSSQNVSVAGQGQADFASKAFTVSLNVPTGGTIKVLLVHGTEYVQVPAPERSRIPGHKSWVSVNLNKVSQAKLGTSFSQLAPASDSSPTQALSQLLAVSDHVSKVGGATVAGVPTTEYRAQVNLHKVAAEMQAKEGPMAAQAVRQEIKALGTATVPVDIWIDAHHLVRQIRYQAPLPPASTGGAAGRGTMTSTITFTRFGVPVHLSPPPAGQIFDITSQLIRQGRTISS